MITKICTQCSTPFEAQFDDLEHPQTKCLICCPMCQIHGIPLVVPKTLEFNTKGERITPLKCEQCEKEEALKLAPSIDWHGDWQTARPFVERCQKHNLDLRWIWPTGKVDYVTCSECAKEQAPKVVGGTDAESMPDAIKAAYERISAAEEKSGISAEEALDVLLNNARKFGARDALKHFTGEVVVWQCGRRRIVVGGDCSPPLRYQERGACGPWKSCHPDDYHNEFTNWLAKEVIEGRLIPKREA